MKFFKAFAVTATCAAAACMFAFAGCGDGAAEVTLESLSLDTSAVQTVFDVGEAFSAEGLKVNAVYSDDTSKEVTGYTLTPPDMSAEGEKEVGISYTEDETTVTASYTITVVEGGAVTPPEQSPLRLALTEVQREFASGEAFTAAGLKVFLREGEEETELSAGEGGYELTAPVFDGAGAYTVTVAYGEHSLQYTVAVIPDVGEDMTIEFVSRDESASLTLYITERMPDKSTNTTDSTAKGDRKSVV